MKRRRSALGSSTADHQERAAYHRNSMNHGMYRGLVALKAGDCMRAFHELISVVRQDGIYQAHVHSGAERVRTRSHKVVEFEVAFTRACPIGKRATLHGGRR